MFSTFALNDIFADYKILHDIKERREYNGISVLPQNKNDLMPEILYTSRLSELSESFLAEKNIHFAAINDLELETAETICRDRDNLFCLQSRLYFSDFLWRIQERFSKLANWERALSDIVLSGGSYQDIVDKSEDILKNPTFVLGPDLYLLATTKNYSGSTEEQRAFQKNRYHSSGFIEKLKQNNRFSYYKHHKNLVMLTDHKIEPYDIVGSSKFRDGEICFGFGVSCSVTPNTPYYRDLIATCVKYVFALEEREYTIYGKVRKKGTDFIWNLISGETKGEAVIRDISKSLSLPFEGPFCLYKILFPDNNYLPGRLYAELTDLLPEDFVFSQGSTVLILHTCESIVEDTVRNQCSKELEKFLKQHICKCTISEPFENLTGLQKAFEQNFTTEQYVRTYCGEKEPLSLPALSQDRFKERVLYSYREFVIRDIFNAYKKYRGSDLENIIFVRVLKILMDYDQSHNRNLVEILYYYLTNESNATKTAELTHMSRNNVQYNLGKIQSLTGFSMGEHHTRFGMLIAYELLGIYFE